MINKIAKLNKNAEFGKSRNLNRFNPYSKMHLTSHDYVNDRSEFSSASQLLRKINWKLKKLNRSKNSLALTFLIDLFTFEVDLPLSSLRLLNNVQYKISKEFDKNRLLTVEIENRSIRANHNPVNFEIELVCLSKFFNQINKLNNSVQFEGNDSIILNSILNENIKGMRKEFDLVNGILLSFIEKYENINIRFDNKEAMEKDIKIKNINFSLLN